MTFQINLRDRREKLRWFYQSKVCPLRKDHPLSARSWFYRGLLARQELFPRSWLFLFDPKRGRGPDFGWERSSDRRGWIVRRAEIARRDISASCEGGWNSSRVQFHILRTNYIHFLTSHCVEYRDGVLSVSPGHPEWSIFDKGKKYVRFACKTILLKNWPVGLFSCLLRF